jgi:hypothetical protein
MNWASPFAIFRVSADGKLQQVHVASDLKSAKYWLTYIAAPGDVLCKTPLHPKHTGSSPKPEYWSHKENSGQPASSEQKWIEFAKSKNCDLHFPEAEEANCS